MSLTKPTAILFDWDNTLVDSWPVIHTALNMTLRHMQHPEWSLEKVMRTVKKSMREAFPELFGVRWEEAADHYQQSYRSINLQNLKPIAGATELLRGLQPLPLAVVSNKRGQNLRDEVAHLNWGAFFKATVGAGDATRDKPSPDPALLALKTLGIAPSPAVWFVGDTVVDLECATAAGLTPILYGDYDTDGVQHEGSRFAAHVLDLTALGALIRNF